MRKKASDKRCPNHRPLWLRLILAGMLCICVTGLHEANGAQSIPVNKAVTPGDHDVFIPPPASPTDPADITVTITATNCWIIVSQETTASEGWSGSGPYQHVYKGDPWAGYPQGVFQGKLERDPECDKIPVGTGGAEPEEDYTVTSTGSPTGYFIHPPGLTTVCVGEPAVFTSYRWNGDDYVGENSSWTTNGFHHANGTSVTFSAGTSADVYNITATSTSDDTLSDTATLIVVEVVSITPEPTIACYNSEKEFQVETYPAGHYDKVSVTGSNCTIMAYDTVTGKVTVKFDDVSTHATDYKIVTATCGTSSEKAKVTVFKVDVEIRTEGERTPNEPPGFNTAYWYDPTEDEWGLGNPAWKELGFFTDPHGDSRGRMEGKASITPACLDSSAIEFHWRQYVLAEVEWFSPTSYTNQPSKADDPYPASGDNIPDLNSAGTKLCIFMRDDPGGPFPGTATTESLQYRRRINFETWVEFRISGSDWAVCSDKERWYIRYAFARSATNDAWQVDVNASDGDNSVGKGTTSTCWGL